MNNNRRYYHEIFTTSRKFYHEIFILEQNLRNHESFLPQKFGAIWYCIASNFRDVKFS